HKNGAHSSWEGDGTSRRQSGDPIMRRPTVAAPVAPVAGATSAPDSWNDSTDDSGWARMPHSIRDSPRTDSNVANALPWFSAEYLRRKSREVGRAYIGLGSCSEMSKTGVQT